MTPISTDPYGTLIQFHVIPAGGDESSTRVGVGLFLPQPRRREPEGTPSMQARVRAAVKLAYESGREMCKVGAAEPYDLTQPQFVAFLVQRALLACAPDLFGCAGADLVMTLCTPQEAARHGSAHLRAFRVVMREGDAPALWWTYRVDDPPSPRADVSLHLLDLHGYTGDPKQIAVTTPKKRTPPKRSPRVRVGTSTWHAEDPVGAAGRDATPAWELTEYAALQALRERLGGYDPKAMRDDGATPRDESGDVGKGA